MKAATPILFLAAGAAAGQFRPRDLAQVSAAVSTVLDGLKTYDGEINKFNGGDPANLLAATTTMINTVKTAVVGIKAATNVSLEEAMNFKPLSDAMNVAGDAVLTDLNIKVAVFEAEHLCGVFHEEVGELGDNVVELMNDVASKFPSADASKDEIAHFTTTFADLVAKLAACAGTKSVTVTDCPTGGAGVYPTQQVTSVPSMLPSGYTPVVSHYTPSAGGSIPTKVGNTTTSPATGKPTHVVVAGAATLKLSVVAVAAAALLTAFL
ncbi:hypothetical protein GQ53DRAFT_747420 [Thozetella sp. PMI_491]|nr:hypothetical protein GQ53DRAFT_747420 [Thozetella sp. PMI_491]